MINCQRHIADMQGFGLKQYECQSIGQVGRRITVAGVLSSNLFIYSGMDIIAKVDEVSGEFTWFTRALGVAPGVGDVIAETRILGPRTQTYVYVQTHRGDTVALVGSSGLEVGSCEYDAWGNVTTQSGVTAWFTFSGKRFDEEARLQYYGYRWYDPEARRWTQEDPMGLIEGVQTYGFLLSAGPNAIDVLGTKVEFIMEPGFIEVNRGYLRNNRLGEIRVSSSDAVLGCDGSVLKLRHWIARATRYVVARDGSTERTPIGLWLTKQHETLHANVFAMHFNEIKKVLEPGVDFKTPDCCEKKKKEAIDAIRGLQQLLDKTEERHDSAAWHRFYQEYKHYGIEWPPSSVPW